MILFGCCICTDVSGSSAEGREKGNDPYDLVLDALSNSTKMSVLLLLARNEKLTVTQMARHIRVTRSNLYHFVAEMVKDGLLAEPEVVVKKNHIEKYYSQNQEFWKAIDPFAQNRRMLEKLTPDEGRKLLRSALLSMSLQYRLYADEFANATDEEMERVAEQFGKNRLMLSVWSVDDDVFDMVVSSVKKLLADVVAEGNRRPAKKGKVEQNSVYIACIPDIFNRRT